MLPTRLISDFVFRNHTTWSEETYNLKFRLRGVGSPYVASPLLDDLEHLRRRRLELGRASSQLLLPRRLARRREEDAPEPVVEGALELHLVVGAVGGARRERMHRLVQLLARQRAAAVHRRRR